MALPYPEGEVFFKRSVLKSAGSGLDPENLTSFNSHALIEWCWNENPGCGGYSRSTCHSMDAKSDKKRQVSFLDAMIVMFGTADGFEKKVGRADSDGRHDSRHSGIKRMIKTKLPVDTDAYEKRMLGGPLMTAVTPVKLDPDEPYMYIDLTFPIRAIYFPLAQKPSTVFPDLCSYLMVDFRLRQGVKMYDRLRPEGVPPPGAYEDDIPAQFRKGREETGTYTVSKRVANYDFGLDAAGHKVKSMNFDNYAGLGVCPQDMLSVYIPGVYNYLILPRQMRSVERGLYMPADPTKSVIRVHPKSAINSGSNFINPTRTERELSLALDLTKVLEGHLGIQVVWQPFDIPEPEDANKMIFEAVEAGLCFIPVVGPLASSCFGLFIDIVNNPAAFKECNPFEMSGDLLENAASAAEGIADGLPKASKAGKIAKFLGRAGVALTKIKQS